MFARARRVFAWILVSGLPAAFALATPAAAQLQTASTSLLFPRFHTAKKEQTEFRLINLGTAQANVTVTFVCGTDDTGFCAGSNSVFTIEPKATLRIDVKREGPSCREGFGLVASDQLLMGSYEISRRGKIETGEALLDDPVSGFAVDFRAIRGKQGSELTLVDLDAVINAVNPSRAVEVAFWSEAGGTETVTNYSFRCFAHVLLDDIDTGFRGKTLGSERGLLVLGFQGAPVVGTLTEGGKRDRAIRAPVTLP